VSAQRPVLTYLLWAPLGRDRTEAFAAAYREHAAGIDHELVVAASGHGPGAPLEPLLESFAQIEHTLELFEGPRTDLMTYRELVDRRPQGEEFVFVNSYARPLGPGWLRILVDALREPGVGIAGVGGSFETPAATKPPLVRLAYLPLFPRFPDPHIRTAVFALTRSSIELLRWPRRITSKRPSYLLEGGRRSITRQLQAHGLRPVIAGRDGRLYDIPDWPASATFRSGDQENLLVADLRSDDYAAADAEQRAQLGRYAWGASSR
jgi:hypothetical protein